MRIMDLGYPKPITVWRGVPESPQGAFVDKANGTICPAQYSGLASKLQFVCQAALISDGHWQGSIDWNLPHLLNWVSVCGTLPYIQYRGMFFAYSKQKAGQIIQKYILSLFFMNCFTRKYCVIGPSCSECHKTQSEPDCGKQKGQDHRWVLIPVLSQLTLFRLG